MSNEKRVEDFQDRLDSLAEEEEQLSAIAEERHATATRNEYREENGVEMDEFDSGNLNDQAAIDAFDEPDADAASDIDYGLKAVSRQVEGIVDDTPSDTLDEIDLNIRDIEKKVAARRRHLGKGE